VRRFAMVSGGLCAALVLTSSPAVAAKKVYVPQGVRFNNPVGNLAQRGAIDLYLKKLIRHTPKGAEIDVSVFRLTTKGMAAELVRAHRRGAKVRVIVDYDSLVQKRSTYDYLRRNLGGDTRRASWILVCPKGRGCIAPKVKGEWSKNHNKFYAFSRTYDSRNVVVQTSANATGGMYAMFNDAYTMTDAKLYRAYRGYFYALAKRRPNADYYRTVRSGARSVSFFPKAAGDPVADVLDRVGCAGGTRIRVSMGEITRSGVATRLSRLDDAGCDVRVVSGRVGINALRPLIIPGRHGGPQVRFFTGAQKVESHSKYLLIDGWYNRHRTKMVLTGSHNYTTDALRHNDESLLTIRNGAVHDAYVRNFNTVFAAAKGKLSLFPWLRSLTSVQPPADEDGDAGMETQEAELPAGEGA
jgi:phosphatidylserine/phosphatidylglycerophosphate/cardiolipin synthase-like enzyme